MLFSSGEASSWESTLPKGFWLDHLWRIRVGLSTEAGVFTVAHWMSISHSSQWIYWKKLKKKKKNQSNYVTNSRVAEEMVQPEASQEAWSLYAQHCVEVRPAGASWVGVGVSGRRWCRKQESSLIGYLQVQEVHVISVLLEGRCICFTDSKCWPRVYCVCLGTITLLLCWSSWGSAKLENLASLFAVELPKFQNSAVLDIS